MSEQIEQTFKPLHISLARLRLFTRLLDPEVELFKYERAELYQVFRDLTRHAVDAAADAEQTLIHTPSE